MSCPTSVFIADGRPLELKAQKWEDYSFTLPERACTLTGRVEGISGGQKDFEGFVIDDDNYGTGPSHEARGTASGRVVVWSPQVTM